MSNPLTKNSDAKELKNKFLELTASGLIETLALERLGISKAQFLRLYLDDPEFSTSIEEARKMRADYWVSKIVSTIDTDFEKDEIPNQRLKFEKLQFLARSDNPERYGNNSKKLDINIDLTQFKLLSPEIAKVALAADPFAPIEADYTEVSIKQNYTEISIDQEEDLL